MRMVGSRIPFKSILLLVLDEAPVPVLAQFGILDGFANLTFDKAIDPASNPIPNLVWRVAGFNRRFVPGFSIVGSIISGFTTPIGVNPGSPLLTYTGFPTDLLGIGTEPVANFQIVVSVT